MLHYVVLLENLIEHFERTSAIYHEIFRDDLKPIDHRLVPENVPVMGHTQAEADAVLGKVVELIGRHKRRMFATAEDRRMELRSPTSRAWEARMPNVYFEGLSGGWLPSVAHPPLPLQEFFPLQPLLPALQPPLPLQEFSPLQE